MGSAVASTAPVMPMQLSDLITVGSGLSAGMVLLAAAMVLDKRRERQRAIAANAAESEMWALLEAEAAILQRWAHVPTLFEDVQLVQRAHRAVRPDLRLDRFVLLSDVAYALIDRDQKIPGGDRWRMLVELCTFAVRVPVVDDEEAA